MPIRTRSCSPSGHSTAVSWRCRSTAVATASAARSNAAKYASPCVSMTLPPLLAQASSISRPCSARRFPYSVPNARRSSVEPSMSVKRKVTVPRGRSLASADGSSGKDAAGELGDRVHLDLLAGNLGQHLVRGHAHPGFPELADERARLALREPVVAEALAQVRSELRLDRPRAQVAGDVEARVDVGKVVGGGGLDLQRIAEQLDIAVRELRRVVRRVELDLVQELRRVAAHHVQALGHAFDLEVLRSREVEA